MSASFWISETVGILGSRVILVKHGFMAARLALGLNLYALDPSRAFEIIVWFDFFIFKDNWAVIMFDQSFLMLVQMVSM